MRPLALIVAMARDDVIGQNGRLPWRLPDELAHFKATTLGHCLILGRKTWESLPGALPGRTSIVVTRREDYSADRAGRGGRADSADSAHRADPADGVEVASSVEGAIARARELGDEEPIVAGGAEIYTRALPMVTRIWLTRVHADVRGDVHFPEWNAEDWLLIDSRDHAADPRHAHAFTIEQWQRRDR